MPLITECKPYDMYDHSYTGWNSATWQNLTVSQTLSIEYIFKRIKENFEDFRSYSAVLPGGFATT